MISIRTQGLGLHLEIDDRGRKVTITEAEFDKIALDWLAEAKGADPTSFFTISQIDHSLCDMSLSFSNEDLVNMLNRLADQNLLNFRFFRGDSELGESYPVVKLQLKKDETGDNHATQ